MEEKTLDDGQYGSEEQQETKGFGDSTECGWMQGILGLSDSGDRCREGGPRVEAIFDVGHARLRLASRFSGERPRCGIIPAYAKNSSGDRELYSLKGHGIVF